MVAAAARSRVQLPKSVFPKSVCARLRIETKSSANYARQVFWEEKKSPLFSIISEENLRCVARAILSSFEDIQE